MIGKAALCEALGWTRPKLDRRLESDENFPIAQRGTRAGGWAFDLAAVRAYLESGSRAPASSPAPTAGSPFDQRSDPQASGNPYLGAKYSVVPPACTMSRRWRAVCSPE